MTYRIVIAALLALPACSGSSGADDSSDATDPSRRDVSVVTDATFDTADALPDTARDAAPDVTMDADGDVDDDAETGESDAGSDVAVDAPDDTAPDAVEDTSADAQDAVEDVMDDASDTPSDTSVELPGCLEFEGESFTTYTVTDPLANLQTDPERPDASEVYCVPPSSGPYRGAIVMVPGLGLSHYVYLTTPDRRDGWATQFAAAGYAVYVVDPSASKAPANVEAPDEEWSIWAESRIWSRWGFGAGIGEPYDDTRFPTGDMADFVENLPYYRGGRGGGGSEVEDLLEQLGSAVLLVHSASGPTGFSLALGNPDDVSALVVIEPTGCPTEAEEVATDVPLLAVYGDYVESREQTGRFDACSATTGIVADAGGEAAFVSFPADGVFGNTHLMMQDNNNGDVSRRILAWLDAL